MAASGIVTKAVNTLIIQKAELNSGRKNSGKILTGLKRLRSQDKDLTPNFYGKKTAVIKYTKTYIDSDGIKWVYHFNPTIGKSVYVSEGEKDICRMILKT